MRGIVERGEMVSFALSERGAGSDPAAWHRSDRRSEAVGESVVKSAGSGVAGRPSAMWCSRRPGPVRESRALRPSWSRQVPKASSDDVFEDKMGMRGHAHQHDHARYLGRRATACSRLPVRGCAWLSRRSTSVAWVSPRKRWVSRWPPIESAVEHAAIAPHVRPVADRPSGTRLSTRRSRQSIDGRAIGDL